MDNIQKISSGVIFNLNRSDFLIIGAGIIGLTIARELIKQNPKSKINILEKEPKEALHSSGRNSGVLHAGFYYSSDSLKAKFTKDGNEILREYCNTNNLQIKNSQKIVVAKDETELEDLFELQKRGKRNGVDVTMLDEEEVENIDPNVKTHKYALFSPNTATVDPKEVVGFIKKEIEQYGVKIHFNTKYENRIDNNTILTTQGIYQAAKIINCAGLYADKIAKDFGFSQRYTILPFKGVYLKYTNKDKPIKTNIYPVPNLKNPFLGVHFTITQNNTIKIGPTAIPAFSRENYNILSDIKFKELMEILYYDCKLFLLNKFNFRGLAFDEFKKYNKDHLISLASSMVKQIDKNGFTQWSRPGLRAQLLNVETLELVQDFTVEGDGDSIHVLNAVSPAFTSSFPFSKWVVENYIIDKQDIKYEKN